MAAQQSRRPANQGQRGGRQGGYGNGSGGNGSGKPKGDPPVQKFRAGRIKADVWQHQGQEGPWFSVTITRSYTDDKGEWHTSNSYGLDDLLVVAELSRQAWVWVSEEVARLRAEGQDTGNGRNGRPPHNPDADNC